LRSQIDDPNTDENRKNALTSSLERAVKKLEELEPEVSRERLEAESAHQVLEEADAQYKSLVEDLPRRWAHCQCHARHAARAHRRRTRQDRG